MRCELGDILGTLDAERSSTVELGHFQTMVIAQQFFDVDSSLASGCRFGV
jgi:hypothetical protein